MTPRELFDERVRIINEHRWADLAGQYADDAVVEQPFGIPDPIRLIGREAVAAHLNAMADLPLRFTVRDVLIHDTADAQTIIAEFTYHATNTATGATADIANIQVLRSHDGLLVETRDYHDHHAIGVLLGRR